MLNIVDWYLGIVSLLPLEYRFYKCVYTNSPEFESTPLPYKAWTKVHSYSCDLGITTET